MNREVFVTENFYHIFNRGVDKRTIFLEERDYERFLISLYLLNDTKSPDYDLAKINLRGLTSCKRQGEKFVDIVQWCLMPNHFHLFLRQNVDNGISRFMQKVGTSYTMFFNKKHERSGRLFQGTYKSKPVLKDEYFSHLASYIPLNAVDIRFSGWRENGLKDLREVKEFLLQYKWSSYRDYFGKSIVGGLVSTDLLVETIGSSNDYEKLVNLYLSHGVPELYKDELFNYEV